MGADSTYMGISRRNTLIGLGGLIAGGGALAATGAFDTVEAERTVSVETAGDSSALLALTPADDDYVSETDGTVEVQLDGNAPNADGVNQNAVTTFDELVEVTNQGTQNVDVSFDITDDGILTVLENGNFDSALTSGGGSGIFGLEVDTTGQGQVDIDATLTITADSV